jgi:hypothetical protein
MKISETFSSSYFKAIDFPTPRTLVIESVVEVTFDEGPKPAIRFQGERKQLVLNKTNAKTMVHAYGDDTEAWRGHQIQAFAVSTFFQGRPVKGICVQPLTRLDNASGQIPLALPPQSAAPQPAVQQLPPSLTQPSTAQPSTPQPTTHPVAPSVQAPIVEYDT